MLLIVLPCKNYFKTVIAKLEQKLNKFWLNSHSFTRLTALKVNTKIIKVNFKSRDNKYAIDKPKKPFCCFRNKPRMCRIFKEANAFGFSIEYDTNKGGYYVEKVQTGGPAKRSGLKV